MPLTDAAIRAAKPADKPQKLYDSGGLFLLISPAGGKWWRFRYAHEGKEKLLSLGTYPDTGLKEAREKRDAMRKQLADGIEPGEHRKAAKEAVAAKKAEVTNTFEMIAREWLDRQTDKAQSTQDKNRWLMQFAIDAFGSTPITKVTPSMVLIACRREEDAGHLETAHRIRSKCGQVFRYAVATERLERDPTTDLRGALKSPVVKHRAAFVDPKQVAQLLRDIDTYTGYMPTICALKLAPLVFIRPGELRAARWADINLDTAQWSYTPPKTRNQTGTDLIVPLSRQAVAILRELHTLTNASIYVFPQLKDMKKCMSENTINGALRRMGYTSEEMCGHGFRATARTILEEVLDYRPEWIELQLAHAVKDPNGRAYNRTKFLPQRQKMMQAWSDYLDTLKAEASTIPIKKSA